MGKPDLLITRPMPDAVITAAGHICQVNVRPDNSRMTNAELANSLLEFDAVLSTFGDDYLGGVFPKTGKCRAGLIANFGVGFNHIDRAAARGCGVVVTNTPGAVTEATADIAMSLILMAARRIGEGERLLRAGCWQGWHPTQLMGMHLGGKTLGVIGMGRIGKAVARKAYFGFGMKVVFFNRSPVSEAGVPDAQQLDSIAKVMAASDVVSVSVPGGADNRHLISADVLQHAKPGSFLVNTARGDVIDEAALIDALRAGVLAGAGLDVYENEPLVPAALLAMENVVLLPHMGTNALEVRTKVGLMAVENIRAFFAGEIPPNLVT